MKNKKLLNFSNTQISDVKYLNPLFSTCSIKVMYVGENRNMTTISKEAVEKALPSIYGAPIVGEYNKENNDYRGHGGKIDLSDMSLVKTTRPYGFVPHDATYRWEKVTSANNGQEYEYLILDNCRLWTGNYPEAFEMLNGKGQSMEIIVNEGKWSEETESYVIDDFLFSALCVLGDDVEPCFEDAGITASYSQDSTFQMEYRKMLEDAKATLYSREDKNLKLEELLTKYSTTMKELTEKGFKVDEVNEDNLESAIAEVLEVEVIVSGEENGVENDEEFAKAKKKKDEEDDEDTDNAKDDDDDNKDDGGEKSKDEDDEDEEDKKEKKKFEDDPKSDWISPEALQEIEKNHQEKFEELKKDYDKLVEETAKKDETISELTEFKLKVEKETHETQAKELFEDFQLTAEDVHDVDIHAYSLEELNSKCYEIFGRKMKESKKFSKESSKNTLILHSDDEKSKPTTGIDRLVQKFNKDKK